LFYFVWPNTTETQWSETGTETETKMCKLTNTAGRRRPYADRWG